jgi:glycosyltransferase involved in cell wall biosynthesis
MLYLIHDTAIKILVNNAIPVSQGGSSSFVAGFINHLFGKQIPFGLIGNFGAEGVNIKCFPFHSGSNLGFLFKLTLFFLTRKFSKSDILYFHRPDHLALAWLYASKKILHLHGPMRITMKERRGLISRSVYFFLERRAMHGAALIITTDKRTAILYSEVYPFAKEKIHIFPAGMAYSFFSTGAGQIESKAENTANRLIFAGRLAYPKRIFDIIEAFAIASEKLPHLELHIAGDGPLREETERLVHKKVLEEKLTFHGVLSKDDLRALIHTCKAGILLSHSEGSPISVKEKLACGKPVIVSDVGDCKDYVIEGKTGYIVDADNHQQVADAIMKAFADGDAMAAACMEIAKQYDEAMINDRIFRLIKQYQKQ